MSPRALRVLRVLPSLSTGGTERQCLEVCEQLLAQADALGIAVELATCWDPIDDALRPPSGLRIHRLGGRFHELVLAEASLRLRGLIRRFDCVHALLWPAMAASLLAQFPGGPPVVASFHSSQIHGGALRQLLHRGIAARAAAIVFNNQPGRDALCPKLGVDPKVVPVIANGKTPYDGPWPAREGIACMARAIPSKRHDLLIEALARLPEAERPKVTFAGRWTDTEDFRRALARLGPSARGLGEISEPMVELAAAEIAALPTDHEGMPNAVLEGWNAGCAVIASRVAGCRELVRDGVDGILVDNDVDSWVAGLRILADPDRRRGLAEVGRERVLGEFSLARTAERWVELYRRHARGRHARRRHARR